MLSRLVVVKLSWFVQPIKLKASSVLFLANQEFKNEILFKNTFFSLNYREQNMQNTFNKNQWILMMKNYCPKLFRIFLHQRRQLTKYSKVLNKRGVRITVYSVDSIKRTVHLAFHGLFSQSKILFINSKQYF